MELTDKWLRYQKETRRITPESLRLYQRYAAKLGRFLAGRALTTGLAYEWIGTLTQAGLSDWSVRAGFKTMRAMTRWAAQSGELARDPLLGMRAPIVRDKLLPYAKREEFVRLYRAIRRSSRIHARRDALIEATLWYTGLRVSECLNLRPQEVDLRALLVRVLGKGGQVDEVPVHPQLARLLRRWLAELPAGAPRLFPSQARNHRGWGRLGATRYEFALREIYLPLAGLAGLTPHAFRRGAAKHLDRCARAPAPVTQKFLRHRTLASTTRYTSGNAEEVRHWSNQM